MKRSEVLEELHTALILLEGYKYEPRDQAGFVLDVICKHMEPIGGEWVSE